MKSLRIGIAGLGVVGSGVLDILVNHLERIERAGANLCVTGISARDQAKDRGVTHGPIDWYADPIELAVCDKIDVFVELIGGPEGVARHAVTAALESGKHVVTANKALLAKHGLELATLAEGAELSLCYEAAVAAGVPVIRSLRSGASACRINKLTAMLNGTCNYILSQMTHAGVSYEDALREAQQLGFAEADPSLDVGGDDAAQKLVILAMIAFDSTVEYGSFPVLGIENLTSNDIAAAGKLGYRIKLVAVAERNDDGYELRVHPALVDKHHSLAKADGADNYLIINADPLGQVSLAGPGAGQGATAAAIVADLIALSRGTGGPVFNTAAENLVTAKMLPSKTRPARFFLRLTLKDVPGAIAGISETLAEHGISIDSLIQPSVMATGDNSTNHDAMVVLATHVTTEAEMIQAANEIRQKPFALGEPSLIRIEDFS